MAAFAQFEAALASAQALDDPQSRGLAEQGLVTSSVALGRLPQAIEHAHRAAEAYRQSKRSGNLAYALMSEAEQKLEVGDPSGEQVLAEAEDLAKGNPRLQASVAVIRADFLARQGDLSSAKRYHDAAARFHDDESPVWRARLLAIGARLASPAGAQAPCRSAVEILRPGVAFDVRASVLLSCAAANRSGGQYILTPLKQLAGLAERIGNHAVAWRAWGAVAQLDQRERALAEKRRQIQWLALQEQWGNSLASRYAGSWKVFDLKQ
ncbi:MAG: hypothetical protein K2X03_12905 [Bryobacteraceae bacterium]|nr:hypothetical protein [Bryobacteraceae bacterium]